MTCWQALCAKIRRRNEFFYSKRTNYLLHNLTLRIRDKEIAKEFQDVNCDRFNSLFFPVLFMFTILLIYRALKDFSSEENETLKNNFCQIPDWTTILGWVLFKRYLKSWSPIGIYYYTGVVLLFLNLRFRNKLNKNLFDVNTPELNDERIY